MNESSFLWHDFETFGADPRRDRPAQFAALRTDDELEPIDDPLVLYCQPGDDVLPQPAACLITGITPQEALAKGAPEHVFAERVHQSMSRAGTCSVGYNNFRFDDEVTRFMFWRNFIDPYAREYSNGNSRFDLIDVLRMTRALRPEGLEWPDRDDGTPSFRLEDLAKANGMDTSRAHDALADVEATLGMARRVRTHQPRLWNWALGLRKKHAVAQLLEPCQALVHSSARFPGRHCSTSIILPIASHPSYSGQWIVWDLRHSPEEFEDLSVDDLADRLWVSKDDLPEGMARLPVKLVRTNRCPMLSPLAVLDDGAAERISLDTATAAHHASKLADQPKLIERLTELFRPDKDQGGKRGQDPELALYDGFVARADSANFPRIRQADADELRNLGSPFEDERLNRLLFRYRARRFPQTLDEHERRRWDDYRRRRLLDDPDLASIQSKAFEAELVARMQAESDAPEILEALAEWHQGLNLADLS